MIQYQQPAYTFGGVNVWPDTNVVTPAGTSRLVDTEIELGQSIPQTHSRQVWNGGMVAVSVIVALFTCGLGLLLLFLSRSTQVYTTVTDTVTIKGPTYHFVAQGAGGAQFVSWVQTWRYQLDSAVGEALMHNPAPVLKASPPPPAVQERVDAIPTSAALPAETTPTEVIKPGHQSAETIDSEIIDAEFILSEGESSDTADTEVIRPGRPSPDVTR